MSAGWKEWNRLKKYQQINKWITPSEPWLPMSSLWLSFCIIDVVIRVDVWCRCQSHSKMYTKRNQLGSTLLERQRRHFSSKTQMKIAAERLNDFSRSNLIYFLHVCHKSYKPVTPPLLSCHHFYDKTCINNDSKIKKRQSASNNKQNKKCNVYWILLVPWHVEGLDSKVGCSVMPKHKFYPITCQFQGGPTLVFYETRDMFSILLETVERATAC